MLVKGGPGCIWMCTSVRKGTVYPKKYAHGFVVLCFVVVMQSFIMNSHEVFIHIHQGCFAGTGAIVRLPQCQWSKLDGYGKTSQCITTTKRSKAKFVCIFLGIYCIYRTCLEIFIAAYHKAACEIPMKGLKYHPWFVEEISPELFNWNILDAVWDFNLRFCHLHNIDVELITINASHISVTHIKETQSQYATQWLIVSYHSTNNMSYSFWWHLYKIYTSPYQTYFIHTNTYLHTKLALFLHNWCMLRHLKHTELSYTAVEYNV